MNFKNFTDEALTHSLDGEVHPELLQYKDLRKAELQRCKGFKVDNGWSKLALSRHPKARGLPSRVSPLFF